MAADTIPALPCMCASLRRATRAVSQLYEDALRPAGLRGSQFTILQLLSRMGELSQGQIAHVLSMDSTTLTRTLAIMLRHGWLSERRGHDRRQRWLRLSRAGEAQFKRALPLWEQIQTQLQAQVGDATWEQLFHLTNRVTNIVTPQGV